MYLNSLCYRSSLPVENSVVECCLKQPQDWSLTRIKKSINQMPPSALSLFVHDGRPTIPTFARSRRDTRPWILTIRFPFRFTSTSLGGLVGPWTDVVLYDTYPVTIHIPDE